MAGKPKYKVGQVAAAIKAANGLLAAAAHILGCDRSSVYVYVKKHPTLAAAMNECRAVCIDRAELKLMKAVEKGEPWAIAMVLKTIGKERGYVERQEIKHDGSVSSNVTVYLPKKQDRPDAEVAD